MNNQLTSASGGRSPRRGREGFVARSRDEVKADFIRADQD
jgi:hypothetical protein